VQWCLAPYPLPLAPKHGDPLGMPHSLDALSSSVVAPHSVAPATNLGTGSFAAAWSCPLSPGVHCLLLAPPSPTPILWLPLAQDRSLLSPSEMVVETSSESPQDLPVALHHRHPLPFPTEPCSPHPLLHWGYPWVHPYHPYAHHLKRVAFPAACLSLLWRASLCLARVSQPSCHWHQASFSQGARA